jgi:glycosyltransferase involved in cell wall biosynthesis
VSRTPQPSPSRTGASLHAVQVVGGGGTGTGPHVRALAAGLVARGVSVTVCAPPAAERQYGFTDAGAWFAPAPAHAEPEAVAALNAVCAGADVVHAHGPRTGVLASLALGLLRRRVPLVTTWHTREAAGGTRGALVRMLERRSARAATVLLGATGDLVARARRRGARDARLAPVAVAADDVPARPPGEEAAAKLRAEIGALDRPLLVSVGPLDRRHGHRTALNAARSWRHLPVPPLLVVAGEGPLRAALRERILAEDLPVALLGCRADALRLPAAADLTLVTSRWEGRALPARAAMRAGVPVVATRAGGLPELVGDAGLLVPYGDAAALAGTVTDLLDDPDRRAALGTAGRAQAATWPSVDDTVAQVLSVYDELVPGGAAV